MKEQDKGRASSARFHEKSHTRAQPKPKERSEPARNPVFDLQRTVGNQAVASLLGSGAIQAKLWVSQPGDADEREADRVADQVVEPGTASAVASPASGTIHRKCDCPGGVASCPACEEEEVEQAKGIHRKSTQSSQEELSVRDDFLQALGSGQPLGAETREFMESRFGEDFGRVRVHTDEQAANSARSLRAKAYTFNSDIVFDSGAYEPSTPTGKKLLAHELSHVTQQRGGSTTATAPASHPKIQRQFGEIVSVLTGVPEPIVDIAISPYRQFAGDLVASVKEAPDHAAEILVGEVWDAIKEHWLSFILTTAGLIGAEIAVGILTAVPEPTLITKAIALILQLLIIAIIGYFAAVELVGVYEEGRNWFSLAKEANGDPKKITEASKSFLRMVRHIILAILAVAGVRAKIRGGLRIPGASAASGDIPLTEPPTAVKAPPGEPAPPPVVAKPPTVEPAPPKAPPPVPRPPTPEPHVPKPPTVEPAPPKIPPPVPKPPTPEPEVPKPPVPKPPMVEPRPPRVEPSTAPKPQSPEPQVPKPEAPKAKPTEEVKPAEELKPAEKAEEPSSRKSEEPASKESPKAGLQERLEQIRQERAANNAKIKELNERIRAANERAKEAGEEGSSARGEERARLQEKAQRNAATRDRLVNERNRLQSRNEDLSNEEARLRRPPIAKPTTWQEAEEALRKEFGGQKKTMSTDLGERDIDCYTPDGIAREAKFGPQSLTEERIQLEIDKDAQLLKSGKVKAVEWHFYENVKGLSGASGPLLQALRDANIKIVPH